MPKPPWKPLKQRFLMPKQPSQPRKPTLKELGWRDSARRLAVQLQENGFTQSSSNPDFIVAFYSRVKEKTEINSTGFGYGPAWGWGYGIPYRARWRWGQGPNIWTYTYTQGCVMADIIDTKTQELVWRGVVKDTVNGIGQSEKQVNSAAKDLIQRFLKDTRSAEKQRAKNQAR